jgi:hypothetical protein
MTNLLKIAAVGATLFGLSTPAWADGPSTTIVNNGNNNVNIVVNVQGPTINVPLLPPPPAPGCYLPPAPLPTQNFIFNQGYGNANFIHNRGWERGPVQNTIVNYGNHNHNEIRNHFR